jgi:small acid-soluble spore protein A (major alpha-type SASP)
MKPKINSTSLNGPGNVNRIEIPAAREALDNAKYELADEMGINVPKRGDAYDWRMVPSYYCGAVGGEMTKRMIQFAEVMAAQGHDFLLREKGEGNVPHETGSPPTPYEGPTKDIHQEQDYFKH